MKPRQMPKIVRAQNDSIYNMSHSKGIPELPPLPAIASEDASEIYELIQRSSYYPPLMQRASWTLAAPFKEQCYFRRPSDSIANNYTLTASNLKMKDLKKIPTILRPRKPSGLTKQTAEVPPIKEDGPSEKKPKLLLRIPYKTERAMSMSEQDAQMRQSEKPEWRAVNYFYEDPLTPEEQFVVMLQHEEEINRQESPPTERDVERYCYYIHKGIRKDMLAPQPKEVMENILERIPSQFLIDPNLEEMLSSLTEEIQDDYHIWLMKNIVDYILMDPEERKRLFIHSTPRPFPQRIIRAPVPWHDVYREVKSWNHDNLFTVNPMMLTLQHLWFTDFSELRFVRTKEILEGDLPLLPEEFEELIQKHCQEAHEILLTRSTSFN